MPGSGLRPLQPSFGPPPMPPEFAPGGMQGGPTPRFGAPGPGHVFDPHSPYGPPPMPPPHGYGQKPGPAFPGAQLSDLRGGRLLIAAALAILVAAVTVSIVLAVTGS